MITTVILREFALYEKFYTFKTENMKSCKMGKASLKFVNVFRLRWHVTRLFPIMTILSIDIPYFRSSDSYISKL